MTILSLSLYRILTPLSSRLYINQSIDQSIQKVAQTSTDRIARHSFDKQMANSNS